jgi:hypothetical protein
MMLFCGLRFDLTPVMRGLLLATIQSYTIIYCVQQILFRKLNFVLEALFYKGSELRFVRCFIFRYTFKPGA